MKAMKLSIIPVIIVIGYICPIFALDINNLTFVSQG